MISILETSMIVDLEYEKRGLFASLYFQFLLLLIEVILIFIYVNVWMMVCPHISKHPLRTDDMSFISCDLPDFNVRN